MQREKSYLRDRIRRKFRVIKVIKSISIQRQSLIFFNCQFLAGEFMLFIVVQIEPYMAWKHQ